jgi:phytanoyl-CoA hydroxylase
MTTKVIPDSYYEHGFFIQPGVFTPERCTALIEAAEALATARGDDRKSAMNPHRDADIFFQTLADPAILAPVSALVGGEPTGLQTQFYYNDPGTKGFTPHQDNYFVEAPPDAFVSAWIALVDVDRENGGLMVWPGTNRLAALPIDAADDPEPGVLQHANARREASRVPAGYEPVDVVMPQGSVVFMDGWLVHASHTNVSRRQRYALLCTYLRKGAPFRPGNHAKRTAIDLVGVA